MTFKKILTVMTVALSALVLAGAAFAADTVGTIDTQKVMFQHPKFQQVQRQVRDVTEKLQKDSEHIALCNNANKLGSIHNRQTRKVLIAHESCRFLNRRILRNSHRILGHKLLNRKLREKISHLVNRKA